MLVHWVQWRACDVAVVVCCFHVYGWCGIHAHECTCLCVCVCRNLYNTQLSGTLPESIGKLTSLTYLCASLSPAMRTQCTMLKGIVCSV